MGLDKLFRRNSAPKAETAPASQEAALNDMLGQLDSEFGKEEVNKAIARLQYKVGEGKIELANLTPASNALVKDLGRLGKVYPIQALLEDLALMEERWSD